MVQGQHQNPCTKDREEELLEEKEVGSQQGDQEPKLFLPRPLLLDSQYSAQKPVEKHQELEFQGDQKELLFVIQEVLAEVVGAVMENHSQKDSGKAVQQVL